MVFPGWKEIFHTGTNISKRKAYICHKNVFINHTYYAGNSKGDSGCVVGYKLPGNL